MSILRSLLPYPDPRRRRAARRTARSLIDCIPSAELDPLPAEVAQLALLRLLWLQRLSHGRFHRNVDIDSLVARAAVETLITGLYWLRADDEETERAKGDMAKGFRRLMDPLTDEQFLPKVLIEGVAAGIGSKASPPSLLQMAQEVSQATGSRRVIEIYDRFYRPLSILAAHPSAMALLRHAKRDRVDERPDRIWTTRAARHTADACMAYLAVEVAEEKQVKSNLLRAYFDAHFERATPPMATILGRSLFRLLRPRRIREIALLSLRLRRYYRSGHAAVDPYPVRSAKTRLAFEEMFEAFEVPYLKDDPGVIDYLVEALAGPVPGKVEQEEGSGEDREANQ